MGEGEAMRTLGDYFLCGSIPDLSTADNLMLVVPDGGQIIKIMSVIENAITTADATLTAKINGTAVTGGTITVAYSGSAAWDQDSCEPTAANTVNEGDVIEIETDGGSTVACQTGITVVIRRFPK